MQELFLKLARTPGMTQVRNPSAYVHRAAIHLAFDWRRLRRREAEASAELAGEAPAEAPRLPLATMIQREQWEAVLQAARDLPELAREVFVLHYLHEESFGAIAARLGKTPHQVRALGHKAVGQLRERLAGDLAARGYRQKEEARGTQ